MGPQQMSPLARLTHLVSRSDSTWVVTGSGGTPAGDEGSQELSVAGSVVRSPMPPGWMDNQPCPRDTGGLGGRGWQWGGTPGAGEHGGPSSPAHMLSPVAGRVWLQGTLTSAPARPRPGVPWEGGRGMGAPGPESSR